MSNNVPEDWREVKLGDVCDTNISSYYNTDNWIFINYLDTGNITNNYIDAIQYLNLKTDKIPSRAKRKVQTGSVIYSTVRPNQRHFGIIKENVDNLLVSTGFAVLDAKSTKLLPRFLYYILSQDVVTEKMQTIAEHSTSTYPSIKPSDLENLDILLPPLDVQERIAGILEALDDKIELNNQMNKNLEQQLKTVFTENFSKSIECCNEKNFIPLKELVSNIDNRGKTPPISEHATKYPIIDVRALSGDTRIIDYNKCTKFVEEETYNNWFRSGHPQIYDILISTVGSLAEMKLFLGNVGCIAQNVVGFRATKISPLYLYQYLSYIKNDLVAYDIGSVQPSIKVTHIAKHLIYMPNEQKLNDFHNLSAPITDMIFNNCQKNERLAQLRDTLLPKLMRGEIDVSNVDIPELTSADKLSFRED